MLSLARAQGRSSSVSDERDKVMSEFNVGDLVMVNGGIVATIHTYDAENDRLVYVSEVGGGTDTTYGHISQTRLTLLEAVATAQAELALGLDAEAPAVKTTK